MTKPIKWTLDLMFERCHTIPETGCWIWIGANSRGYGQINKSRTKERIYAHRMAYELANGIIPNGMFVCHKCDITSCINPAHLFLGDAQDNASDRDNKKRNAFGSRNPTAVLTEKDIPEIRRLISQGIGDEEIGNMYGVTRYPIYCIRLNKRWQHVQ